MMCVGEFDKWRGKGCGVHVGELDKFECLFFVYLKWGNGLAFCVWLVGWVFGFVWMKGDIYVGGKEMVIVWLSGIVIKLVEKVALG